MAVVARGVPPFDGSVSAACAADAALVPPVAASTTSSEVTPSARARRRAGVFESACAAAAVDASEMSLTAGGAAYDNASTPAVSLKGEIPHCVSETDAPGATRESAATAATVIESAGAGCAVTMSYGSVTNPFDERERHGLSAGESERVDERATAPGLMTVLVIPGPQ